LWKKANPPSTHQKIGHRKPKIQKNNINKLPEFPSTLFNTQDPATDLDHTAFLCPVLIFHNTLPLFMFSKCKPQPHSGSGLHLEKMKRGRVVWPSTHQNIGHRNLIFYKKNIIKTSGRVYTLFNTQDPATDLEHTAFLCPVLIFHNTLPLFIFPSASPSPFRQGLALRGGGCCGKNEEGEGVVGKSKLSKHTSTNRAS
jgi:hypothetical protein